MVANGLNGRAPEIGHQVRPRSTSLFTSYAVGPDTDCRLPAAAGAVVTIPSLEILGDSQLTGFLGRFRRAYPFVPLTLHLNENPKLTELAADFARLPSVTGVLSGHRDRRRYRPAVTDMDVWRIERRLSALFDPKNLSGIGALTSAVRLQRDPSDKSGLVQPSVLRRQLDHLGIPGPQRWRMLGQALPVVLRMQRQDLRVAEAAYGGGYPEPSAFRRHCRILFSTSPSTLRGHAGWEPLLGAFLATNYRFSSTRSSGTMVEDQDVSDSTPDPAGRGTRST